MTNGNSGRQTQINPGWGVHARSACTLRAGGRQVKGFLMNTGRTLGICPAAFSQVPPPVEAHWRRAPIGQARPPGTREPRHACRTRYVFIARMDVGPAARFVEQCEVRKTSRRCRRRADRSRSGAPNPESNRAGLAPPGNAAALAPGSCVAAGPVHRGSMWTATRSRPSSAARNFVNRSSVNRARLALRARETSVAAKPV